MTLTIKHSIVCVLKQRLFSTLKIVFKQTNNSNEKVLEKIEKILEKILVCSIVLNLIYFRKRQNVVFLLRWNKENE